MSNQQFLKSQTCVIRVNIHCDGCKQKVRKLLQKIEGVYTVTIDAEQGKVSVTGNIDPDMLVKKLVKSGKHAELWGSSAQKGSNNFQNQFKNMQILDNFSSKNTGKDQKKNKSSQKGGDKDQSSKTGQVLQQIMQQMKGSKKHAKVPSSKDKKSDKFHSGNRDFSEFGDGDFDSNDDDFDSNDDDYEYDDDSCDDDDEDEILPTKGNKGHGHNGNAKKGGAINVPIQSKGKDGKNDAKNKNSNGGKNGNGDSGKNKGGDKNQSGGNAKNGGKNDQKAGSNGKDKNGGGKNNNNGGSKKGGGKNDGFKEVDVNNHGKSGAQMGNFPMGQMGNFPMGHMGNIPAMHGLPAPAAMNGGYYHQGMGNNPYNNQQYMAMMMNAQQRANGNGMNQQMMYARPHAPVSYGPPIPAPVPVENYTHMFSDENTSGCNIM